MSIVSDSVLQLCRLCASYQAIKMEIFGREGRERNLVEKIEVCLPFKIREDDALPKSLCYRCMYLLENFHDFRTNCVNSVRLLESCVSDPEGRNVEPALRLEFEQLKSQLHQMDLQREKERLDGDDFMPHLEPQVTPACDRSWSRRSSSEGNHPSPGCSPPRLERNEEAVSEPPCDQGAEQGDSDSNSWDTSRVQTRRRLNHSPMHDCKLCGQTFVSWSQLNVHKRSHTRDLDDAPESGPFSCDLCCKSYALPKHLWTHVSTAHRGDPAVTCPLCRRVCMNRARLEEHRCSHRDEGAEPRRHMQAMLNTLLSRRSSSQQCAEVSLLKQTLLRSRWDSAEGSSQGPDLPSGKRPAEAASDAHSGSRRKNSCPRKISRERAVSTCEDAAEAVEQFVCDVCSVVFETAQLLADHKVVHKIAEETAPVVTVKERPFTCLLCEKSFTLRQSLSRHLLSCHGIDPQDVMSTLKKTPEAKKYSFPNTDDSAAFDVAMLMKRESTEEQSNKNFFSCEVCIREFNDRSSLWLHMLYAHKDQAMYACGVCLKVCANNDQLMVHWKEHINVCEQRRYICQICGRQHDTRKKLVIHAGLHCLDDGRGGCYDPEAIVLQNHAFYNPEQKGKDAEGSLDTNSLESKSEGAVGLDTASDSFTCEVCCKTFLSEEKLVKHKKNSHKEETSISLYRGTYQLFFVCELCGSSHHSKSERWRHVYKCHGGEAMLRCDRGSCEKVFTTRALRHEHCASHHQLQGDTPNTCEVCGKLWSSRVDFWKHMMGVHSDLVPLTCGVCLKILCDVAELKLHVRRKHWPLVGDYCCDICGRAYSNQSKMSRHRKVHEELAASKGHSEYSSSAVKKQLKVNVKSESKPYLPSLCCDACPEQQFGSISQLAEHRRNAHSLYPCDICTKFYGRTTHLLNHVRRKHKDEPQLMCPLCSKLCSSSVAISSHIAKNHTPRDDQVKAKKLPAFKAVKGTYGQKCSYCSKTFWKRSVYRKHIRSCRNKTVADVSSVQTCELCDVSCSSKTELVQHIRARHLGHPNFTCSFGECSRVLRSLVDLEMHLKMHTMDVGTATCDLCGEVYDSKPKIWKHLYSCHRLKDLEGLCGICLRALPSVDELKAHLDAAHPGARDKPNTCRLCARTYTGAYKVLLHVAKCHASYSVCKICLEMFADPSEMAVHEGTHAETPEGEASDEHEEPDTAEPVPEETSTERIPEKRQSVESGEAGILGKRPKRSYGCDLCTRVFQSPSALSEHKKQFHLSTASDYKPYHCSTCSKHFSNKTNYWKHINSPSHASMRKMAAGTPSQGEVFAQEDSRTSYVGSEGFDSSRSLQEEESLDQEEAHGAARRRSDTRKVYAADATVAGPYFCCLCGKKWPGRKHLWQHLIRNHRNEAAVTCGVCLTVCSDYQDLSRHLSIQHPGNFLGDGNNFTCRTCGRYHNARCKLLQHVLIHIVLGPGPEKQPPSLTELMEAQGARGEDQASPREQFQEAGDSEPESAGFLSAYIELTCQQCDSASFDSLEDLLKHQETCQGAAGSEKKQESLVEETADSSQSSSDDSDSSSSGSSSDSYIAENGVGDGDEDVLPECVDYEVFGDEVKLGQKVRPNTPSIINTPQSVVDESASPAMGDVDLMDGSYFEEESLENMSYDSKGCIRVAFRVGEEDLSSEKLKQAKSGCDVVRDETSVCAVGSAAGGCGSGQVDRCADAVSNGLPEDAGSPVEAADGGGTCVVDEVGVAGDLLSDSLNSLGMLNAVESVDM
ncbi:zinc finger protein 91-like [Bacillus rossius redtenbacheri]|uniref:zinc finger protein 91-like n=1 Tax=Bacillus rossius redtenbacheri TaxID=93214 RepID=UPI002FDEF5F6